MADISTEALNIFLKHYAKSANSLATIGASKTFSIGAGESVDLGSGLTALRGFFTSVRAATNRILVNINVSHGAFYQEGQLTKLMEAFGSRSSVPCFPLPPSTGALSSSARHNKVFSRQTSMYFANFL